MTFKSFIKDILKRRKLRASHLAMKIGVSHATVSRWLSGKDKPGIKSCGRLAEFSGMPVEEVLEAAGYIASHSKSGGVNLPEFAEYARIKYADELDEDMIIMIEYLIERRRANASSR